MINRIRDSWLRIFMIVGVVVAGIFIPGYLGLGLSIHSILVLIGIFAIMSYGLDIIVSDLGEVSLAHTVFFGVGGYTVAALSTHYGIESGWITLAATIVVSLATAGLIGLITLHLRDFVFSLVTYAMTVVAIEFAENSDFLGRTDGLRGIPPLDLSVGDFLFVINNDIEMWPAVFVCLCIVLYAISRFRRSALGTSAIMVHLNPRLAVMSGINPRKVRLQIFMLSAPISAIAGWFYGYQRSYISADLMGNYFLIMMLTAVVLFGKARLFGPLVAVTLVVVQERLFSINGDFDKILLGLVLITVLAVAPNGLFRDMKWLRRKSISRGT